MPIHYVSDHSGNTIAVQIPIAGWNRITEKYADIEELPQWQKNIIDERLDFIKNHPDQLIPIEEFLKELDADEEF